MTEFITRNYGNENFEIIIKTDSKEHYKATQDFARGLIDHTKPAPTIEAKPVVHAHWEKPTCINGRAFSIYHCSACGEVPCGIDNNTKYCPNCGAQMDEKEGE